MRGHGHRHRRAAKEEETLTENVGTILYYCDTFACINFRGFMKMGNFPWIKICVLSTTGSLGFYDSNFHSVYNFHGYLRNAN